jgi:hypothetical protein
MKEIAAAIAVDERPRIPTEEVIDVVFSHDTSGDNYVWLWPTYGKVLWIDFQEPAGQGEWRPYNKFFFGRHGALVSHQPEDLVEEHVRVYIDPETRKIALKFWFQRPDGSVYSKEPTRHFYELERDWFAKNNMCQGLGARVSLEAPRQSSNYK